MQLWSYKSFIWAVSTFFFLQSGAGRSDSGGCGLCSSPHRGTAGCSLPPETPQERPAHTGAARDRYDKTSSAPASAELSAVLAAVIWMHFRHNEVNKLINYTYIFPHINMLSCLRYSPRRLRLALLNSSGVIQVLFNLWEKSSRHLECTGWKESKV